MLEFIDKTSTSSGTPLNRKAMMAVQGFENKTVTFNDDGSITETNADGDVKKTTFNGDGSVTETFSGMKSITKRITFTDNGVKEVLS